MSNLGAPSGIFRYSGDREAPREPGPCGGPGHLGARRTATPDSASLLTLPFLTPSPPPNLPHPLMFPPHKPESKGSHSQEFRIWIPHEYFLKYICI